jgi:hypothetical protein
MPGTTRDPVSQTMDQAARALLTRAYRARGGWAATRLKDPTPVEVARWWARGIHVLARDPAPRGGMNARTRWGRAYVRALWYQHKWYSAAPGGGWRPQPRAAMRWPGIQVEIGPHRPATGVIPAGRPVRVRVANRRQARASDTPEDQWAWADNGARRADISDRDWQPVGE